MIYIFLFIGGLLLSIFWGGYVTATLWGWFLVPLGVKSITYWHAVGISTLIGSFLGTRGVDQGRDDESMFSAFATSLLGSTLLPAMCLALGWLAKINL